MKLNRASSPGGTSMVEKWLTHRMGFGVRWSERTIEGALPAPS